MILDRVPLGRNETSTMSFVRRHDEYEGRAGEGLLRRFGGGVRRRDAENSQGESR